MMTLDELYEAVKVLAYEPNDEFVKEVHALGKVLVNKPDVERNDGTRNL